MTQTEINKFEYRIRFSYVWNYEMDETWLTSLSAQGIHLAKPGVFRYRFEKDHTARYVYRLDYQNIKGQDNLNAYNALFEDSGWEHVGSCMGWHYFRKPYREGESYEIYTDRSTVKQLFRRVQFTLGFAALANIPLLMINMTNLFSENRSQAIDIVLVLTVFLEILCILLLAYGCLRFQQKIKKIDESSL